MKFLTQIVALICSVICGCTPQNELPSAEALYQSFDATRGMSENAVAIAVENAANSQRAVVFVYVDWAFMRPQLDRFAEFAIAWQSNNENLRIGFHFIDFTEVCNDYRPLTSLPGWPMRNERPDVGRIGGYGEVVWIADGRVVHIQTALDFASGSEMATLTHSIFDPLEKR